MFCNCLPKPLIVILCSLQRVCVRAWIVNSCYNGIDLTGMPRSPILVISALCITTMLHSAFLHSLVYKQFSCEEAYEKLQ